MQDPQQVADEIADIRSRDVFQKAPKPIVFNEDSTKIGNLDSSVAHHASWGYYDQVRAKHRFLSKSSH